MEVKGRRLEMFEKKALERRLQQKWICMEKLKRRVEGVEMESKQVRTSGTPDKERGALLVQLFIRL